MNEDHADAVLNYARHFGGLADASSARLDDLDQTGMAITATLPVGRIPLRVAYSRPLDKPEDAHPVLVEMALAAQKASAASAPRREDAVARARDAAARLRDRFKTVVLATVSADGLPEASVAPAVVDTDGTFHVYVSGLSTHTRNLAETGRASVLIVQDEAEARQALARQRVTFACAAESVARDTGEFRDRMDALREKFGPVMEHLEGMSDFRLFRLRPSRGRVVAGFGQAYDLDPRDWGKLSHVNDTGHTPHQKA